MPADDPPPELRAIAMATERRAILFTVVGNLGMAVLGFGCGGGGSSGGDRETPIDIAGVWISTDGLQYRVRQDGQSIRFDEYDEHGNLVGNGTGVIRGRRIESEFQSTAEGRGRSQLVVSDDGQRMSGDYLLLSSGESGQTMLFRQ